MRMFVHGTTRPLALGPGAAVSLVAHAVLIGGAVHGTARSARELQQRVATAIWFMPPPDRVPGSQPRAEHVLYVDVSGGLGAMPAAATEGTSSTPAAARAGRERERDGAAPSPAPAENHDSVYSVLGLDESATRVEGSGAPVYPPALLAQHVEGAVVASYVIDSTGYTDTASVEILSSTHEGFVRSVLDALPLMRFHPGMVDGRRVRQRVQQTFSFRITDPVPGTVADHTRTSPPQ